MDDSYTLNEMLRSKKIEIRKIHFESTWDLRHRVMWPDRSLDYVKLPNDDNGLHYALFANDQMISVISAFISNKEVQFRKFATLTDEQGQGYGTKLLTHLFHQLPTMEATRVWCNARTDKAHFYERFEMTQTDKGFNKGGISYVIMEKLL